MVETGVAEETIGCFVGTFAGVLVGSIVGVGEKVVVGEKDCSAIRAVNEGVMASTGSISTTDETIAMGVSGSGPLETKWETTAKEATREAINKAIRPMFPLLYDRKICSIFEILGTKGVMKMNVLAIITATIVGMGVGALWYSPRLFANQWMRELKLDPKKINKNNAKTAYMFTAVGILIETVVLGQFIRLFSTRPSALDGALIGLMAGLGLLAPAIATNHIFEGKSQRLFLITAGHHVATFIAIGAVLGLLW